MMNRIYKVIRKRFSDEVVVVSELTKERGKGQGALNRTRRKKKLSSLMRQVMRTSPVMGILLFSGVGNSVLAQEVVGDSVYGTRSHQVQITPSQDNSGNPVAKDSSVVTNVNLPDESQEAIQGTVSIGAGGTVLGSVTGGSAMIWAQAGDAKSGSAAGVVGNSIAGVDSRAESNSASVIANENSATVGDYASVGGSLYGGSATVITRGGNATAGKAASINESASAYSQTFAFVYWSNATANANTVTVGEGVTLGGSLYGGFASIEAQAGDATTGDASVVSGSNGANGAYTSVSAFVNASGGSEITANENTVAVGRGVSVAESIYGGSSSMILKGGNVITGNAVVDNVSSTSTNANTSADTYINATGAKIIANANTVTVAESVSIDGALYGGSASFIAQSGDATVGSITANNLTDVLANVNANSAVSVASSTVTADGNTLTVGAGTSITGSLYGGSASMVTQSGNVTAGNINTTGILLNSSRYWASGFITFDNSVVTANDNKVIVGDHSDLRSDIYGGYAGLTVAEGTTKFGTVNGNIIDGSGPSMYTGSTRVLANNNEVSMSGTLTGSIYGGSVLFDITPGTILKADNSPVDPIYIDRTGSMAQAIENTITLEANAQINSPSGSLYGGYLEYDPGFVPESYDVFSGNTLNFSAKTPALVQNVGNFEYYNFILNPIYVNTSTALISADDISFGANTDNMDSSSQNGQTSKIKVVGINSGNVLNAGDAFILMKASNTMTSEGTGEISTGIAQQGISLLYDVETTVDSANKKVTATILGNNGPLVNPQLKSLAEGYLLGSQLVTRGADLIADDAYRAIQEQNPQGGWSPFVILSGQHNRYNSGSHIKSNDFLMAGGLSYQQKNWLAGAFLEGGWGSYDSYNSFSQVSDVHGTGNDRYYGLGLLGRYQLTSGFYSDASVRFGRNRTKFDTNDIQNLATGEFAHYNLTSNYVSGHVGVGYLVPLAEKNELDISAKYLYTTLSGKNATIAGDRIDFDRVDSNRIRLGIQLNHQYSKTVTLHSGLAYEYEFDGKAGANTYGMSIGDAPSLKGSTGILSIGALVKARPNLNVDLKLNGYTGKREGFGANLKMTYLF